MPGSERGIHIEVITRPVRTAWSFVGHRIVGVQYGTDLQNSRRSSPPIAPELYLRRVSLFASNREPGEHPPDFSTSTVRSAARYATATASTASEKARLGRSPPARSPRVEGACESSPPDRRRSDSTSPECRRETRSRGRLRGAQEPGCAVGEQVDNDCGVDVCRADGNAEAVHSARKHDAVPDPAEHPQVGVSPTGEQWRHGHRMVIGGWPLVSG
jgi:hypothetical protein